MFPLLHEINTLIQTNLEDIAADINYDSHLQALDAYCQQMEDYRDVLEEMIQALGKEIKQLRNKQRRFETLAAGAERSAKQFQEEGQHKLALAAHNRKKVMELAARTFREEADSQNEHFRIMMDAKLRLEARLTEVAQKRTILQAAQPPAPSLLLPI
jgi:phage shock protein A